MGFQNDLFNRKIIDLIKVMNQVAKNENYP